MFTPRITWPDLPPHVRDEVEQVMGATVVEWSSQFGGFSPGTADRLLFDDGRRIFCKAVSEAMNTGSAKLYRDEIAVNRTIPDGLPVPTMLHSAEWDDGWVLLLFDDLEGRHPYTPWREDEFGSALTSISQVAEGVPVASEELPDIDSTLGQGDLGCWAHLADDIAAGGGPVLDPWLAEHLDEMVERSAAARQAIRGTALCQLDARADNMVLDASGQVWLVDWPWACRGAAWVDGAMLGLTAVGQGVDFDLDAAVDAYATGLGATRDDVTNLWAGELGFFVSVADLPDPPGLPTIRAHHRRMRDALIPAVRRRLQA
ncbi:hypothetical protein [Aestuariimicrobium ganziense]|uniref:hypothetical protein n=1 Tax=Aestuariimicrobium ganziense TaxID=2773677 RepID=UPI0019412C0D|nr:hypothetical protein [Aestuariimicrobium ganziense]